MDMESAALTIELRARNTAYAQFYPTPRAWRACYCGRRGDSMATQPRSLLTPEQYLEIERKADFRMSILTARCSRWPAQGKPIIWWFPIWFENWVSNCGSGPVGSIRAVCESL